MTNYKHWLKFFIDVIILLELKRTRPAEFFLTYARLGRLELTYFAGKKPKNRPVCENAEKCRGLVWELHAPSDGLLLVSKIVIFCEIIEPHLIQRRQTNDSWPTDRHELMIDHRSHTHNLSSCEIKPEKIQA